MNSLKLRRVELCVLMLFAGAFLVYFSPALLLGKTLAFGDSQVYYLPYFRVGDRLWQEGMLAGFSAYEDIQAQVFYPLKWLSPTFNFFVISAYLAIATGMFMLARSIQLPFAAAILAATVVSFSSFMIGHMGHVAIIHAAAWIPWLAWAIVRLNDTHSAGRISAGAIFCALCLLGGHPQISIMGLMLAGCIALAGVARAFSRQGPRDSVRLLATHTSVFLLGILVSLPALLGTYISGSRTRLQWSRLDFNSFSHTWDSLRLLLFPNWYGAFPGSPFGIYSGPFNLTELALYVGFMPVLLAIYATTRVRSAKHLIFWIATAVVSLFLCLGTLTPFGELLYHMPVIGRFRAQARFALLFTIATAILAAWGMTLLASEEMAASSKRNRILAIGAVLIVAMVLIAVLSPPLTNAPSILARWLPIAFGVAATMVVQVLIGRPTRVSMGIVILFTLAELASFGWFYEWRYASTPPIQLSKQAGTMLHRLSTEPGRVYTLGANTWAPSPLRPNLSILFGVPLVSGYGPLVDERFTHYVGVDTTGATNFVPSNAPLMDVLGVKWIAGERATREPLLIGRGCNVDAGDLPLVAEIPSTLKVSAVKVVTNLSCSQKIPTATFVATLSAQSAEGGLKGEDVIRAGLDTAEWAWDRPDVRASISHSRAHVVETFHAGDTSGLWFESRVMELANPMFGGSVSLSPNLASGVPIRVKSIQVRDALTGSWHQIPMGLTSKNLAASLGPPVNIAGLQTLQQREEFRAMAWATCTQRVEAPEAIVSRLRQPGALPVFGVMSLEKPLIRRSPCTSPPKIRATSDGSGHWHISTRGVGDSILAVSARYNEGWRAFVDKSEVEVVPAYGVILGIPIPGGTHEVDVVYRPRWLFPSLTAMAAGILCILLLCTSGLRRRPRFQIKRAVK